jgi:adenylate kinase
MNIKFKRIFIMGKPLAGKSTQCCLFKQKYNIEHLSIGILLRKLLQDNNVDKKLKEKILNVINTGILLDRKTKNELFENKYKNLKKITFFDGLPRNINDILDTEPYNGNDCFILIMVSKKDILERLSQRLYCEQCAKSFIKKQLKNNLCVLCKKKLVKRTDDNENILIKRMNTYNKEQNKVLKILKEKKINIFKIKSTTINQTFVNIEKIIVK